MARKIITIDIYEDDKTFTVDTEGFHGKGCKAIQEAFESMGTVVKENVKPEYYQGQGAGNHLVNGQ